MKKIVNIFTVSALILGAPSHLVATAETIENTNLNNSYKNLASQQLIPDPVLLELINTALRKPIDYEPTESELLSIKTLNFSYVAGKVISDWTGLEKLTNLNSITDSGRSGISANSNFLELISKINQLPNIISIDLTQTNFDLSVLSTLTSTTLTNIAVPLPITSVYTYDFRFLEQVLQNPNLKTIDFYYNLQNPPSTSLKYINSEGSESLKGPLLPAGYSLSITGLPQNWVYDNSKFIYNSSLEKVITISGQVNFSGPLSNKIRFGSRFAPGASFGSTFTFSPQSPVILNVHDTTLYVGDAWTAEDNFDSALDKDGNAVDFSQVSVDASKVDTSKAGTYDVTYTYDGVTSTAKVTVKDKQTAVNVHDSTLYVGDAWTAEDNFDSALDKDGNAVDFSQVSVDASKVDTSKAGTYDVTYTYDGVTST
ncbi:bacterial Ig-like domain-containing protein, partial [Lactococcus petauri]